MGNRDARRLGLIHAALQGKISHGEGAAALGLSVRQFRRLRRRVRQEGARGVVHGNRGRPSARRLGAPTRARVHPLLTGEVKVNDHHLAELVSEEGLPVSAASVRRERRRLKLAPKRRRRPPRHRRRRERAARRGALVLIDGSPFRWFSAGEVSCSLLGALDDATGEILALTFRPTEDLHGYGVLLRDLVQGHGIPLALYGDRSGILVRNDAHWTLEEQLAGRQHPTQFGHMIEELAIRFIAATSPQAKGRIERLWGRRSRIASPRSCASRAMPHWRRRAPTCPSSWPVTTAAGPVIRAKRVRRSARRHAISTASSRAATAAWWHATTPSRSPAVGPRSRPGRIGVPGTARRSRSANCSMVACGSSIPAWACSSSNRLRRARSSSNPAAPSVRLERGCTTASQDRPRALIVHRFDPKPGPAPVASARPPTSVVRAPTTPGSAIVDPNLCAPKPEPRGGQNH